MVPELTYEHLDVSDGGMAMDDYAMTIQADDPDEIAKIRQTPHPLPDNNPLHPFKKTEETRMESATQEIRREKVFIPQKYQILCRYRNQSTINIPISDKARTFPKINTMSFLYNAYDRTNSIPVIRIAR